MDEEYCSHLVDLCMSLGAMNMQGKTHNEEEALLYEQLCRTITKKAKLDEMAIDASMEELKQKFPTPKDEDDPPGVPA